MFELGTFGQTGLFSSLQNRKPVALPIKTLVLNSLNRGLDTGRARLITDIQLYYTDPTAFPVSLMQRQGEERKMGGAWKIKESFMHRVDVRRRTELLLLPVQIEQLCKN